MLAIKPKDFLSNILPIQKTTISLRLLNERLKHIFVFKLLVFSSLKELIDHITVSTFSFCDSGEFWDNMDAD